MGEFGTDLFRTVDEGNAWSLDAEVAAGADGILYHLDALLKRGAGDDRRVGEEQQFVVRRNLHHGQVRQDFALGQQAVFLVQDGAQQIVRVDDAFHQDVCFAIAHNLHGAPGSGVRVILRNDVYQVRILFQRGISFQDGRIANHQELGDALLQ